MRLFTTLFDELDATNRTSGKVAALERYFTTAPPCDAIWALAFLTGRRVARAVATRRLREWAAEEAGLPLWLLEECYDTVGDLAETLALLLPETADGPVDLPLHRVVEERIVPLPGLDDTARRALVVRTWREMDARQRFVWHKLIGGGFRAGVATTLVVRALAQVAGVPTPTMAHRLSGDWPATPETWERLMAPATDEPPPADDTRPYPFFLAHPLEQEPAALGAIDAWQAEWKWDGIRAQVIVRGGAVAIWSRGEELVTARFPEIAESARVALREGTTLDGEILAWGDERPRPFADLQKRLGRKSVSPRLRRELPVVFLAYDVLQHEGADVRAQPMAQRRALLEARVGGASSALALRLSPLVEATTWEDLALLRGQSRERGVEGLMLKRRASPYGVGRVTGDWWKWKIEPYACDCVLVYAQRGHGRRASLYTDYTFAVWDGEELVPVMKAYSGLDDREIAEVDAWVRRHTRERFGPVRTVDPELVFELAFEGINESTRHKSGVAVRFPRIARWRRDKAPRDADTLATLRALMKGPPPA